MAVSLLILVLLVVFAVSIRSPHRGPREGLGTAVRRFFQFGVQFALVCIVAVGLSSLLGRVLQRGLLVSSDRDALAQGLAFTLVGVPFLWVLARWSARRLAADPREASSLPWGWYLSLGELVPLVVATTALQEVLLWVVRAREYSGQAVATTLVWGLAWAAHRRLTDRTTPVGRLRDHLLAGSAYGLWTAAMGLAAFISGAVRILIGTSAKDLLADDAHPVLVGAAGLAIGAAVWFVYWIRRVQGAARDLHWHGYVLIVGVAAGLAAAIVSSAVVLYDALVWWIGTPATSVASEHFRSSVTSLGWFVAGLLIWWYHRMVLAAGGTAVRDEARRVYEYLVSVIALVTAAVGVMILLVAFIESLTASVQIAGAGAGNTLLLAATMLVVGAPLWWWFWRGIRRAVIANPAAETASPTRRVYLFVLFGVVGVAALIALLTAVYSLFTDLVAGTLGAATLRNMRWGIGILLTAAAVASYHWRVYQGEREITAGQRRRALVLIGPDDDDLVHDLRRRTGARIESMHRLDGEATAWTVEAVEAAIAGVESDQVVVIAEAGSLRAIPVQAD